MVWDVEYTNELLLQMHSMTLILRSYTEKENGHEWT